MRKRKDADLKKRVPVRAENGGMARGFCVPESSAAGKPRRLPALRELIEWAAVRPSKKVVPRARPVL